MAKKSQANTTADVAGNDNSESQDDTIGKENNNSLVITPEVLEAMSGRSLVGMDGRKRRIHVDTQESGFTTNKPHPEDVLLGRGRPIQNHPGNQHMLRLVQHYSEEYDAISRADKYRIVEEIMGAVRAKGGRFMDHVEHVDEKGKPADYWKEVSHSHAYNKVTHAFRSLRRQNLPKDQRPPRSKKCNSSNQANENDVSAVVNPAMASMMHNGMMGYGAPGYPPMMYPADMGMAGFVPTPWGAMPLEMQQAWCAQQQSLMGGGMLTATEPDSSKAASAAAPPASKEAPTTNTVYEV